MANRSLPKTMRGLQLTEFNKPYRFSMNIPVPKIERDNEVLIKIAVAGYCHSEETVQRGGLLGSVMTGKELPLVPSHEGAGTVVAVGSKVANVKVGDRVGTLAFKDPCGKCMDCRLRPFDSFYCETTKFCGVNSNGAAAEYMLADGNSTVVLPPSLSFEVAAPLMCAGSTIYNGLKTANLQNGQTVAIIGIGALGHLGVQFAKCMGLRVVAVDARQAPLDLVKGLKHAPDYTIDATKGVECALKEIGGQGVDATIVATDANAAFVYGLSLTRKHGTFVVIGLPNSPIPVHYNHLIFRNLTIKGSPLGNAQVTKEMVDFVVEKGIEVKTRSYPLQDVDILLEDYHKEGHAGKLVLRVSSEI